MQTVFATPALTLTTDPIAALDADVLLLPLFEHDDLTDVSAIDEAAGGELSRARRRGEISGKPWEIFPAVLSGWKTGRLIVVGAGPRDKADAETLRRLAIVGTLAARQRKATRIAIVARTVAGAAAERAAQAIAEGVCLGNYDGRSYKTDEEPRTWIASAAVTASSTSGAVQAALERGRILGEATNQARALANAPPNELTPRAFAERASTVARTAGIGVEVIDETRMAELRMGLVGSPGTELEFAL